MRRTVLAGAFVLTLTACTAGSADPTTSASTPASPVSTSEPSVSSPTTTAPAPVLDSETTRALERVIDRHRGTPVGLAATPVGGGEVVSIGDDEVSVAWSTMKVPVALAASRAHPDDAATSADITVAIEESDNEAALRLWAGLGGGTAARRAVTKVLREAGDTRTRVEGRQSVLGYSPFGQTRWRLTDQARFVAGLACVEDAGTVLDPMGRVVEWQRWGLLRLPGARAKGGWGPTEDGYVLRQMGLVRGSGGRVAVTVQVRTDTHEEATAIVDEVAGVLRTHRSDLAGGRCPAG